MFLTRQPVQSVWEVFVAVYKALQLSALPLIFNSRKNSLSSVIALIFQNLVPSLLWQIELINVRQAPLRYL